MIWNARNGEVAIKDAKMSYVSFGYGKKSLILLPGLSDGLANVKGKALILAEPYRLFFKEYTVYMFSRKDNLPLDYSICDMANDQAEVLNKLGIDKISILGVSQGGMIAQCMAIKYPELVDKLILAVTASKSNEVLNDYITAMIEHIRNNNHKKLMIETAERSYSLKYLKMYRMFYPIIGLISKPRNYDRFLANAYAILKFDVSKELSKISCPTLIIGGEQDNIVGVKASFDLNINIKQSELYIYKDYGHGAYEEAKDFNRRVYEFLERD